MKASGRTYRIKVFSIVTQQPTVSASVIKVEWTLIERNHRHREMFQKSLVVPQWVRIEESQSESGQGGITLQQIDWLEYQNFLKWKAASEFLGRGHER